MQKRTMQELNRLTVDEFKSAEKLPVVIILDNIRSQNNIGSVFRTADAFRLQGICLCGITATPPHREIHKTALGSTESVDWQYFPSTMEAVVSLQNQGYTILAVEQAAESVLLPDFHPSPGKKFAVIFGNEVNGIENEVMRNIDRCIEIPQYGTKHSINVSVAVGIVIWDLAGKMGLLQKC
jgi:23S rRNA (guanosine2251-2'-O)-methyltransferase